MTRACTLTTTCGLAVEVRTGFMDDYLGILLGRSTLVAEPTLIFTCKKEDVRLSDWEPGSALLRADRLAVLLTADSAEDLSRYLGIEIA
ncbi:hypothetical protein ACQKIE_18595 [Luteibacter sp. NPDC031894]|uniref:hypothetical protein n=1 Tax=Luteibacter sp. NPDC031894 TaxID=3390572 RepID=UPI003D0927CF